MSPRDLSGYEEVPDRIRRFIEKYPDGSLQCECVEYIDLPAAHLNGEKCLHIVYHALAYRHPEDPKPGHGMASEPIPGLTPYTKGSELMNAETSAWGRALVALGFVAKTVASANEVRARDSGAPVAHRESRDDFATEPQKKRIKRDLNKLELKNREEQNPLYKEVFGKDLPEGQTILDAIVTKGHAGRLIDRLQQGAIPTGKSDVPYDASDFEQPKLEGGDKSDTPF